MMMKKNETPIFSIIVPVYNVENYVKKSINSILEQTFSKYEIIIVDDGSTDRSSQLCDEFIRFKRINIHHKLNGGLSDARNYGLNMAKGEYVIFLDSDDFWDDKNFLHTIYTQIEKKRCDLFIFGYKKLYDNGKKKIVCPLNKRDIYIGKTGQILVGNTYNICAWDKVIKRRILLDNNIFFEKGVLSEDMEWCAKILLSTDGVCIINISPYIYRQRSGSISQSITNKYIKDIKENYCKCFALRANCQKSKKKAFDNFLAKNMSMFIIMLCFLPKLKQKEYVLFIKENLSILKKGYRKREKIIYYSIKLIGIINTERFLKILYIRKHQV